MKHLWHESWTKQNKLAHLKACLRTETTRIEAFAECGEWEEVEKAVASLREVAAQLWEVSTGC